MPRVVVPQPSIKVVGVGQARARAVDHMRDYGLKGVEFLSFGIGPAGSSERALARTSVATDMRPDETGHDRAREEAAAEVVRQAVEEQAPKIAEEVTDANVVFITSGESGLGIRGATVVADIAGSIGALTIGVASQRMNPAFSAAESVDDQDLSAFSERVNTLMMVSPESVSGLPSRDVTVMDVFEPIEQAILTAVQGITDLIVTPGLINVDVDDVKAMLSTGGRSLVASGAASGEDRALRAAEMAIAAAHFEDTVAGAKNLLLCIQGSPDLGLFE